MSWISVNTKLPEHKEIVLGIHERSDGELPSFVLYDDERQAFSDVYNFNYQEITHWMPIPKLDDNK